MEAAIRRHIIGQILNESGSTAIWNAVLNQFWDPPDLVSVLWSGVKRASAFAKEVHRELYTTLAAILLPSRWSDHHVLLPGWAAGHAGTSGCPGWRMLSLKKKVSFASVIAVQSRSIFFFFHSLHFSFASNETFVWHIQNSGRMWRLERWWESNSTTLLQEWSRSSPPQASLSFCKASPARDISSGTFSPVFGRCVGRERNGIGYWCICF